MKQRITGKDLDNLTDEQKRRLNELWTPSLYDAAVAKVLKNVATEEYDEYEFVIGGISLYGTSIYLTDITAPKTDPESQPEAQDDESETDIPQAGDSMPTIEVGTFSNTDYLGFGNREDFSRAAEGAAEGVEAALSDEYEEYDEDEEAGDVFEEEDLEDNYQHPAVLIKTDCTPLLTIGNMIEILQRNNFGRFDFYLSACTNEIGCVLGKGDSSYGDYSDCEQAELCDVLWESIKELL